MHDSQPPPVRELVAGKYELVGLIGRGGMGSVWEGRHATLGTRVAIKFIDPEHLGSSEAQSRFANEARAAATIQSKHAIQIFDHGVTTDGRPYIVMELLSGEPLDRRIDRLGRISLKETARTLGQVLRALQRAHDAGIIHRDLKPENIFLVRSPDDDDEIAKVLDFGIAKIKGPWADQGLSSSTKTGAVLGTPYYMAPEQARGLRTIDHRADLWSIGVIAYKCVTGALPFDGESVGDLLVKICTAPPPVPSAVVPDLPAAFDAWFLRALDRDPARRYSTAAEAGDALALAAGMTARRLPDEATPRGAGLRATLPMLPLNPTPTAGGTSAPFTAPALPMASSRGIWVAVLAAVLGGGVGVFAVFQHLSGTPTDRAVAEGSDGAAASLSFDAAAPALQLVAPLEPSTVSATPALHASPRPPPLSPMKPPPPIFVPPPKQNPGKPAPAAADPGY